MAGADSDRRPANAKPLTNRPSKATKSKKRKADDANMDDESPPPLPQVVGALPVFNLTATGAKRESSEEWQTIENGRATKKAKKLPKKDGNYPEAKFSGSARLQSILKIGDLQALVLYLLADGTSPQWIAVRHRNQVRKVVVLMVPGLEEYMFMNDAMKEKLSRMHSQDQGYHSSTPDDYYPRPISAASLPPLVKDFADMFEHLWPVKTPGDDKYNKMHSPLHAMLTAPLSKRQEDKKMKGAKPAREPEGWQNKRTRVSEFLCSADDLLQNDYTLHPSMYTDEKDKTYLEQQRKKAGTTLEDGWVDTNVENFEDGTVPEKDIEQGSITAGREVLALDCEMCLTGPAEFSLTRVSVVSWDGTLVMDELVKPDKPIVDYLTKQVLSRNLSRTG